jgi:hypothetical protein
MMNERLTLRSVTLIAFATVAIAAGCHNAESPQKNATDVNEARRDAAKEVAAARSDETKDLNNATAAVQAKEKALNETTAKGDYNVALAKADGEHKVTIEKCEALAGDAQKDCKAQADATLEAAKANAKATMLTPK